jgi:ACS family hexuronate transporter-like MFS transporter
MALARRDAWPVAVVAMLTMTVSYVDRQTFSVLAPTITKQLDISESAYGFLTSAFAFAYLFATPLSGWWIERIGARRGLLGSVAAWSSIAALHAIVPGFWILLVLRISLGVAEGPSFPGAAQTVSRALAPEDRSRGFSLLFTGSSLGAMIAAPLASRLSDQLGWRGALLTTSIVGLAWIPLWLAATSRRHVAAELDTVHVAETKPSVRELIKRPSVIRAFLAVLAAAPASGFTFAWGSKFLVKTYGIKQGHVGDYLWLPPLCLDVGAILFGDLFARTRKPRALLVVAALMGASVALTPWTDTPWASIAVLSVSIAGGAAMYTLITADVMTRVPANSVSVVGGLIACGQSIAGIISGPLIGRAVEAYGNYDVALWCTAAWVAPLTIVWLGWKPTK